MKFLFPCWLLLLCLSVPSQASAATFYVDNSGSPRCNDTSTFGTETQPWCTVNYASGRVSAGDTVYVKNGTYAENLLISGKNGGETYITIRNYDGHKPILRGSGVAAGRNKIVNSTRVRFIGFTITNYNQGLFVENSSHILLQNLTVHTVGQEGVHIFRNSSYVTLEHSIVRDTRQWQYNGEGVYVGSGSTAARDNTNNVTIKNNTIFNTNDEAIELKPGTHDCIVDGNIIYNVTTDPAWRVGPGALEVNQSRAGNQDWGSHPNHVLRNNIIHSSKTAIRAGTGSTVYNNLIYNTISPHYGIYVDNIGNDSYTRGIYHNTVDMPSSRAIVVSSGTADVKNNIGPATPSTNIATSDAYYLNKAGSDYHLAPGSAPIGAGLNLTSIVPTDIEGTSRSTSHSPDLGAYQYEHVVGSLPDAPTNLSVISR